MSNKNFGIAKAILHSSIVDGFINESDQNSNRKRIKEFAAIISANPTLSAEMKIVESIEGKTITSDSVATRFIDKCLKLVEGFSADDIEAGYAKIDSFIDEKGINSITESQLSLYNSISGLITETAKGENVDVDRLHESFESILNYLKEDKDVVDAVETIDEGVDMDAVIKIATDKFNEKYAALTESQRDILNKLVYGDSKIKKEIFESLKQDNLDKLNSMNSNGIEDKINEGIERINKMVYDDDSSIDKIISLYELKENLG